MSFPCCFSAHAAHVSLLLPSSASCTVTCHSISTAPGSQHAKPQLQSLRTTAHSVNVVQCSCTAICRLRQQSFMLGQVAALRAGGQGVCGAARGAGAERQLRAGAAAAPGCRHRGRRAPGRVGLCAGVAAAGALMRPRTGLCMALKDRLCCLRGSCAGNAVCFAQEGCCMR